MMSFEADAAPPSEASLSASRRSPRPWRVPVPGAAVTVLLLFGILAAGAALRFVGTDWDAGHHLHPDERFLTMVASAIQVPADWLGYLDTDTSTLNPRNRNYNFFSYGTLPISLTRWIGERIGMVSYGDIHLVGRRMSATFDLVTIVVVFLLGARIYDRRVGLVAAALVAFAALHIQQSHFFTVDSAMVTFVTLTLYGLAGVVTRRRARDIVIAGLALGFALACKVAAWPLVPVTIVAVLIAESRPAGLPGAGRDGDLMHRVSTPRAPTRPAPMWRVILSAALVIGAIGLISLGAFKIGAPDVFAGPGWPNVKAWSLRYNEVTSGTWHAPSWWRTVESVMPDALEMYLLPDPRWAHSMEQISGQVTGFGMDWPPNHQWWGKKAYWFPWKNMVLWGMGVPLGLAATIAWFVAGVGLARGDRRHLVLWLFATLYFGFYGYQWAKSIRYTFPIYPPAIVLAAWWLVAVVDRAALAWRAMRGGDEGVVDRDGELPDDGPTFAPRIPRLPLSWLRPLFGHRYLALAPLVIVVAGTALWGLMFTRIYMEDHSRVAGSKWIYHNLPTAFGARIVDGQNEDIRGPWLPASFAPNMTTDGFTYRFEDEAWAGPMRLQVPGGPEYSTVAEAEEAPPPAARPPVTIDAVRLAYARDPSADAALETVELRITTSAHHGEDGEPGGELVRGRLSADVGDTEAHLLVPLDAPIEVEPGGEYYLWARVEGAPLEVRPAVLAYETQWDDIVPLGTREYASYDDGETGHAEGLFGMVVFNMYGEDSPAWFEETIAGFEEIDYWITSSNRVYDSVAQLPMRFPATVAFYEEALFGEGYGFEHVADINSYPGIGPFEVNDQSAEEAFHVYDHPRVNVFERTSEYDGAALRERLEPLNASRAWAYPPVAERRITRVLDALLGRIPVERALGARAAPAFDESGISAPVDEILLKPDRAAAQREGGTWSELFSLDSPVNRWPPLGAVVWYLVLALLGAAAFPAVAAALPNLPDRGWSVARIVGLLSVSWSAWLIASFAVAPHTLWLVLACLVAVASISALVWRSGAFDPRAWVMANRRQVIQSEIVLFALFALFLLVRAVNPDLWHPWYGGEKPMDFAYLNAVVRSVSFPPYDPWFSGGRMNYYYFGFVLVSTLIELTRIVPWVAYNLAIPTFAALTGHAAYGIVSNWLIAGGRPAGGARMAGVLAAVLAVISGNLFQVRFVAEKLGQVAMRADSVFRSSPLDAVPGFRSLRLALRGARQVIEGQGSLDVQTGHWYWNASRVIDHLPGEAEPITEFPFFTFVYGDLHAHMMAMPIAMLVLAIALSWALPALQDHERTGSASWLARLAILALAIGALWPTNTWDFPTYGIVAAGAIGLAAWRSTHRFDLEWLIRVGVAGGALLGLSLFLFRPYHATNVQPYTDFSAWQGTRTSLANYLEIHGIFLFAILPWFLVGLVRRLGDPVRRDAVLSRFGVALSVCVSGAIGLWLWSGSRVPPEWPPTPWVPLLVALLLALGIEAALDPEAEAGDRFAAWLLVVGAGLTGLVEYVVLAGDIGRMNTVFKFYIHVWLIWAALAAYAAGRLSSMPRRAAWTPAWQGAFAVLVVCGLVYPITAARAKARDRYPALGDVSTEARANWDEQWHAGLSGIDFLEYAVYEDEVSLHLVHDRDAFLWLEQNVQGTPVILEAFRPHYKWGARYSIHTGLPTVIGWDWHQKQQRAGGTPGAVERRASDVESIYRTVDDDEAWRLLDLYDVELIVVGELERALYPAEGVEKFDRWVEDGRIDELYANEGVTIYGMDRTGAAAGGEDTSGDEDGAVGDDGA